MIAFFKYIAGQADDDMNADLDLQIDELVNEIDAQTDGQIDEVTDGRYIWQMADTSASTAVDPADPSVHPADASDPLGSWLQEGGCRTCMLHNAASGDSDLDSESGCASGEQYGKEK